MRFLRFKHEFSFDSLKVAIMVVGSDLFFTDSNSQPVFTQRMLGVFELLRKIPPESFVDAVRLTAFRSVNNFYEDNLEKQCDLFWEEIGHRMRNGFEEIKPIIIDSYAGNELPRLIFEAMINNGFIEKYSQQEMRALRFLDGLYQKYGLDFEQTYLDNFEKLDILATEKNDKDEILGIYEKHIPAPILVG